MNVFRQEVLEVGKRIINAIINTQHYFKTYLINVNGLKSDRALYKVCHIAAKLSHETNLAMTKLSLSLIHNTIGRVYFKDYLTPQHSRPLPSHPLHSLPSL